MRHDKYREYLQLMIADEITGEELRRLKEHLTGCDECRAEFNELRQLKTIIGENAAEEPSEQMLWESRRRLFEAIRNEAPAQSVSTRMTQSVAPTVSGSSFSPSWFGGWMGWLRSARPALVGATAVAIGIFIGYIAFGRGDGGAPAIHVAQPSDFPEGEQQLGPAEYTNVRFVGYGEDTGKVEIRYDLVRPVRLKADVNDDRMQRMLSYALLNEENPGVRLQAVNAFDTAARPAAGGDAKVKEALIEAMLSDPNPGVRRQSLLVLQKFSFDAAIQDAAISVLANDRNPGMRVAAIEMLANAAKQGEVASGDLMELIKTQTNNQMVLDRAKMEFIEEETDAQ